MSALILHFRSRAIEPSRVMDPRAAPPSGALRMAIWLTVPVCLAAAMPAMLHWRMPQ
jgi:hypothetical protein